MADPRSGGGRAIRCALAAALSAGAILLAAEILTGMPTRVNLTLAALASLPLYLGYLRSPYFGRSPREGAPCPACGGLGYRVAAHPFYMHRAQCLRCGGSGAIPRAEGE
ncbi:MAG: hypothetical protein AB7I38_16020 [Dehalococcoidia bacterium]